MLTSSEIRKRFLSFFDKRGHSVIPSASLVPENDPSVLFNTAGMQPLVPYLLGQLHPHGNRLVNIQKCVRTTDIEEIGDNTHLTFFEMMGNWSLGSPDPENPDLEGYWKEDAIKWSYELLTDPKEGFGLDPKRLYVTVFGGNQDAPADQQSFNIWKKYISENRIYFLTWNGKKEPNWWSAGDNGPCGPDTEMFYDLTEEGLGDLTKDEYLKADLEQKLIEIWNNVFMEYFKKDGKVVGTLTQKNVDTGSGLERVAMAVQGKNNIFDTDLFSPVMEIIKGATNYDEYMARIFADHVRTSIFLISDGVIPSNKDRGYILRRLIRKVVLQARTMSLLPENISKILAVFCNMYSPVYTNVDSKKVGEVIGAEEEKFSKTLEEGLKEFDKGTDPFILFTSYGFPFELTKELAKEKGIKLDEKSFISKMEEHKSTSKSGAEQKFKGGLSGRSFSEGGEMEVKYHTATHLLHQALRDVLGKSVLQKGSNITSERLRFDFSFERKLTEEEKKKVEDIVNEKIKANLPISKVTMKKEDAEKTEALHVFGDTYGEMVDVYYLGDSLAEAYSKEFCGGPHVSHTGELASGTDPEGNPKGNFKILKEEAVASGIRRIKAILE